MPERLKKRAMRVVGVRQVLRAVRSGEAEEVFLALDADAGLRGEIEREAKKKGIPLTTVSTMEEMAQLCRVDVPSAAAAVIRNRGAQ